MAAAKMQISPPLADPKAVRPVIECGVDECGLGSAIAELYVGACILDPARPITGLADSKKLSAKRRRQLSDEIKLKALDYCGPIATASCR